MSLIHLALKSILSRKSMVSLLVLSIGLSAMLLIGVQKVKDGAKTSFSQSISGTDLIVGARSGNIQLLMATVFHLGNPAANISWETVKMLKTNPKVDWLIPISLGDSHKGYAVVGTTNEFFDHFRYGQKKNVSFKVGGNLDGVYDAAIGAEVAKKLNYKLGQKIYLSHGRGKSSLGLHKNKVFTITGILNPTGTPVDKSVFTSLEGIEALHVNWGKDTNASELPPSKLTPKSVTGCFLGLKSKLYIFTLQRELVAYKGEPLSAIIPAVSLAQLWKSISTIDIAFLIITILVTVIAFIGLLLGLIMSLNQRQKELALLRSMGCRPLQIFGLLTLESFFITVTGVLFGLGLMVGLGFVISPILEAKLGLILPLSTLSIQELMLAALIIGFGTIVSCYPAFQAYRKSLVESMIES